MSRTPQFETFLRAVAAGDDQRSEAAVLELGRADEAALIELAQLDFGDARWWAVRALAEVGGTGAAPVVAAALTDNDPALRAAAALALGHLGAREPDAVAAVLPLLAVHLADDDGFVRKAAMDGFALCGPAALPALADVLYNSAHEGARTRAAGALRAVHSMEAAPLLFHFLNDHNHLVHTYCYEALDDLGLLENMLLMP
jgi:HEAT repeat protein